MTDRRASGATATATATAAVSLGPMASGDWPAVRSIFVEGIATGDATLEVEAPEWEAWDRSHRPDCRLVARDAEGRVVGWAALSPTSNRCVYEGVAWLSVYVAAQARGQRIGGELLAALIGASETAGVWTLQAGILTENTASIALHARAGFRSVGVQRRLGRDGEGKWRDVVLMERRSDIAGGDPPGSDIAGGDPPGS